MKARWVRELVFIAILIGIGIGAYLLISKVPPQELTSIVKENRAAGALIFGFIMFGTTVVAPLTSLPLVPLIAPFLGPFTTGLVSFISWALGAFVAFFIGRRYGRPVVSKLINMDTVTKYEAYIKPETGFLLIVMLRMMLPVDVLSYALGMFSTVTFKTYAIATMLGIVWFSFAFAYLGEAVAEENYVLLGILGVASLSILIVSWYYARRIMKGKEEIQ